MSCIFAHSSRDGRRLYQSVLFRTPSMSRNRSLFTGNLRVWRAGATVALATADLARTWTVLADDLLEPRAEHLVEHALLVAVLLGASEGPGHPLRADGVRVLDDARLGVRADLDDRSHQ